MCLHATAILIFVAALLGGCQAVDLVSTPELVTPGNDILLEDDFSNRSYEWQVVREPDRIMDYERNAFRLFLDIPNADLWSTPGLDFADVIIEVSATKIAGPDENDFGVICRHLDDRRFYFFLVGSDGFYAIGKMLDGEPQLIGMDRMFFSERINRGASTNLIRAECIGNTLTLAVNGTILSTEQDTSYVSGDVGLMAGTFDLPGTDILFDDFVVRRP